MSRRQRRLHHLLIAALFGCLSARVAGSPATDFFEAKVRPVFVKNCHACHTQAVSGGLRVDSAEGLLKGGKSGPAIVPGKPAESLLLKALHYQDSRLKMPPAKQLPEADIKNIELWIANGAQWPEAQATLKTPVISEAQRAFWSFQKVKRPPTPAVKNKAWPAGEIDRFLLAKMESKQLTPGKDATKLALLRRAYFDLTGLPPTPADIQRFLDDSSPNAYADLINRLLDSRAYAERWGRKWLDIVRYADTEGSGADFPIPEARLYRDWVINAFERDMPYDRFLKEQIAGDLLPAADEQSHWNQTIATGYLAIARRHESYVADSVDNLGYAFLGLSVACARCHDHKFDPIPTRDYYAIQGIFSSTRYPMPGAEHLRYQRDFVYRDPKAASSQEALDFERQLKPLADSLFAIQRLPYFDDILPLLQARRKELFKMAPKFEMAYAVSEGTPANSPIMRYGDPKNPDGVAERGFLQILGGQKLAPEVAARQSGRLQMAEWLGAADNPLTARVMVNRIWQGHFGRGIVETPNDFGTRGSPPTNPELLDYLASRFVESGWSMKALHREIMLSRAYRLSSAVIPANAKIDGANTYLWRQERRRLEAEQIRDSMLAISGLLDTTPAGDHPFPPKHEWDYSVHVPFHADYPSDRRTVYLMVQRVKQHPYLSMFDGSDPNNSTAFRTATITPLQALYFMNGKFVSRCASRMADTHVQGAAVSPAAVETLFPAMWGRPAAQPEIDQSLAFLDQAAKSYAASGAGQADAARKSLAALIETMFSSNEFLFID
jgi:mono/diheme cytochrome c family protein